MADYASIAAAAVARAMALPSIPLIEQVPPLSPLARLAEVLSLPASGLLIKRDDAIPFGFGGNKIRKLALVAAQAVREEADTLITSGGVQSNHARATAAVAASLGMRCLLVANGAPSSHPTGNARLVRILGAQVHHVDSREARAPRAAALADDVRARGGRPFVIPIGASTALGACAYLRAVDEVMQQAIGSPIDRIIVSTSSGGTHAGLVAGCWLFSPRTRVIGISADDPSASIAATIHRLLSDLAAFLELPRGFFDEAPIEVDDGQVGEGYGVATAASTEAIALLARHEGCFLDPTYTAKAMAGLIARARGGGLEAGTTLFWHTGGQAMLTA